MEQCLLDRMQQIVQNNAYMKDMHITLTQMREGYACGQMQVTERILNPYQSVHGGALYSLADIISGIAACSHGRFASTVSGNMNYIRPAMNTGWITCEAKEIRSGKRVAVYNVELRDEREEVVETGTFTFYMMNRSVVEETEQ